MVHTAKVLKIGLHVRAWRARYVAHLSKPMFILIGNAQVAQLVEHATENRSVGGSIPPLGTTFPY